MNRSQYYAVKWGETIRISEKTDSPVLAAKECYGTVATNMFFKPLGTLKSQIQRDKWRIEQLTSEEGWYGFVRKR